VGVHMTAQRGILLSIRAYPIGVEITHIARQPLICERVALGMGRYHVVEDEIDVVDGGDAVALAHHPSARLSGDGVDRHIARVSANHVEGAPRMPFRVGLKIFRGQIATVEVDVARIRLMDHQPHGGAGYPIGGVKDLA